MQREMFSYILAMFSVNDIETTCLNNTKLRPKIDR